VVSNLEGETWTVAESRTFLHDGWNMIREIQHSNIPSFHSSTNSYVWGLDLSGSLQGAGGVGGLLAVSMSGQYYFPCHDANGNITAYVNESGSVVAEYAYDAFGGLLAQTGSMADAFRFRFSTKYFDAETDLYYYGYRFYSPELRRWLNRDPIEEEGGLNLYRFCHNNALNAVDLFGLNPEFGVMAAFAYKFGSDVMKPEVSINLVGSTKWSTCDHMTFNADIGHRVMVNGMIGMPRNSSQVYTETYIHVSGTYGTGSSPGLPFYFNGSQWYSALKDRHESSFSLGTTFYSSEAVGENVRMANLRVQGGGRWFLNYHNDQAPGGVKLLSDGGDRGWTGGGMLGFSIGGGQQGIISFDDYSGRASSPNKYDRGNPNVQTAYSKSLNQAQWTLGVSGGGNGMIGVAIDAPWWLNLQNLIHWSISPSAGAFEYPEEIELKLHISGSIGSNRR
jgi:RHS repeat-associated protein